MVFLNSTMTMPAEVFHMPVGGGPPVRLTHENDAWLSEVAAKAAGEHDDRGCGRDGGPVLGVEAAGIRCVAQVSGRLSHSWRTAGGLGRCLVVSLEPGALGCAGLGRRRAESPGLDGVRSEVRRRDLAGLGWQGHGGSQCGLRRGHETPLCRPDTPRDRGRELRGICGRLDHWPHQPFQGRGEPRRRLQHGVDVALDRRTLVLGVGSGRPRNEPCGARGLCKMVAASLRRSISRRRRS